MIEYIYGVHLVLKFASIKSWQRTESLWLSGKHSSARIWRSPISSSCSLPERTAQLNLMLRCQRVTCTWPSHMHALLRRNVFLTTAVAKYVENCSPLDHLSNTCLVTIHWSFHCRARRPTRKSSFWRRNRTQTKNCFLATHWDQRIFEEHMMFWLCHLQNILVNCIQVSYQSNQLCHAHCSHTIGK